jgi:hypothetical protein
VFVKCVCLILWVCSKSRITLCNIYAHSVHIMPCQSKIVQVWNSARQGWSVGVNRVSGLIPANTLKKKRNLHVFCLTYFRGSLVLQHSRTDQIKCIVSQLQPATWGLCSRRVPGWLEQANAFNDWFGCVPLYGVPQDHESKTRLKYVSQSVSRANAANMNAPSRD